MSTTEELIKKIVADQLGIPASTVRNEDSFVADLGADSLDTIELVMQVENEFGIEIPDDEAEKITTVQQAIDYIAKRTASMSTQDKALSELTADAEKLGLYEASTQQAAEPQAGPIAEGWQLSLTEGHSGYGAYAHMDEYPEEGAVLVLSVPQQAEPAQAAIEQRAHELLREWMAKGAELHSKVKPRQEEPAQAAVRFDGVDDTLAVHRVRETLNQFGVYINAASIRAVVDAAQPKEQAEPVQPAEAALTPAQVDRYKYMARVPDRIRYEAWCAERGFQVVLEGDGTYSGGLTAQHDWWVWAECASRTHPAPAQAPLSDEQIESAAAAIAEICGYPGPLAGKDALWQEHARTVLAAAWGVKLNKET